ncbi:phage tail protein [Pseudoalteromonas ardens]|uniref:phage tail-collar fiber domain-containing protein n=1 Tax=Pseudoalteromonas ardens TaxID=3048490 RepID=UPI0024C2532C|nr:phage tail protein [Pseudoalteromonas sp. R96]MDK1312887.1 phage tail protein [Pseudoalteromonas sp. R96]
MSIYTPIITQAGINAAVNAQTHGIQLEIGRIGVGDKGYVPNRTQTRLKNERNNVPVSDGRVVGDGQFHLSGIFTDDTQYAVREVGFYLNDHSDDAQKTLFAIWSHPEHVLFYQTPVARVVQGFDLTLTAVPYEHLTVNTSGDLNLFYTPEFVAMTEAQTNMAIAHIKANKREIKLNRRFLKLGEK